jgi:pimeloyl-ACP methyl ester carboxylesterase
MMQQQFFKGADGVRLAADVGGQDSAPPVVLTHGAGQTRYSWKSTAQSLIQAGYHVVSLDMRGHGESGWAPDGVYSMEGFIGDLRAVLDVLPAPPAIIGASMGGLTALSAIGSHQAVARALVLVDITPKMNPEGAMKIRTFMRAAPEGFASVEEAADSVAAYMPQRARPRNIDGLRRNLREDENGRLHWHWDPAFMAPSDPQNLHQDIERQFSDAARNIGIPTLLVRGSRSEVVDDESVAHFRNLIPHAEFVDVKGAGHMVAGDSNSTFNTAIVDFLARNFPA